MQPRNHSRAEDEKAIKNLREELYKSRQVIIDLMPDRLRVILMGLYRCENREQAYAWADTTVETILALAEPIPSSPQRAYCPLCNDGAATEPGYLLPGGLRRHLAGGMNMQQCSVMKTATALALYCATSLNPD
jgi:hypothetical protein